MITQEERQTLQDLGVYILEDLSRIATSGIFYGIFVLLFMRSITAPREQRPKSLATQVMFGMTAAGFVLDTVYMTAYVSYVTLYMRRALVDKGNGPLTEDSLEGIFHGIFVSDEVSVWVRLIFQTFGDIIVMWRAWVLCQDRRWLIISPLLLLLGACGMTFAYLSLTMNYSMYTAAFAGDPPLPNNLTAASASLSSACNAASTMLIAYRFWIHRKVWGLGMGNHRPHAASVLLLIIESGCVYCILQVVNVIMAYSLTEIDTAADYAQGIFIEGYVQMTAMYPMIVLLLVDAKRSLADTQIYAATLPNADAEKDCAEHLSSPLGQQAAECS